MNSKVERVAFGIASGFAGTLALSGLRSASTLIWPETMPELKQDPGDFMAHKVIVWLPQGTEIPDAVQTVLGQSLALGYGLTAGAAYASLRSKPGNVITEGAALGVAVWAAGYLGWLPALGLMKPVSKQRPAEVIGPIVRHAAFGCMTVYAYNMLSNRAATE